MYRRMIGMSTDKPNNQGQAPAMSLPESMKILPPAVSILHSRRQSANGQALPKTYCIL